MPVIDAHAHFWRRPATPRDAGGPVPDDQEISVDGLVALATSAGVDHIVHITRGVMGYDNRFSIAEAARHPDTVRVLCRFDPRPADIPGRLDALLAEPGVVGLRVYDPPPDDVWLTDGTLEPVFAACEERDVPIGVYAPGRAAVLREIARRHPGLTLIADHLALSVLHSVAPAARVDGWADVLALEAQANVVLKVSGLPEVTQEAFPFPRAQSLLHEVYDTFGASRLMWGSNFPPIGRVCTYAAALDLVRSACDFIPEADRAEILGGTAARVFGGRWSG
ncbi:MAG: hypothetical protein QOH79_2170 [Acidimicrobiaceae bacterium]